MDSVRNNIGTLGNNVTGLAIYLLKVNKGLENSMKAQEQGKGQNQQMSFGMGELMRMQSAMSSGLEQLLQKLAEEGKLTPEMKEMMEQMAKLQSEIQKNLREMMGKGQNGVISGGNEMGQSMEDIIKDLESYKINKDTLEKSKKLEEKLLESKKSIQSKGISEERKAETAKEYEIKAPDINKTDKTGKVDLDSIKNQLISDYYKRLLDKFKKKSEK